MWLKKAQKMRKYYAGCRAKLGISVPSRRRTAASVSVSRPVIEAVPIGRTAAAFASRSPRQLMAPADGGSYGYGYANNPGWNIKPGDRVSFVDRFNKVRTGRAVMPSSYGGWVLNTGGRHGTPALADDTNITKVSSGRARARNPELLVVSNPDRRNAMRRRRRRNSWRGNRKGHRAAALKGWRKRRHGGGRRKGSRRKGSRKVRRSRKGSRRRGSRRSKHFRTFKAAVKRLGVKKGVRAWKASKYYKRKKR